MPPISAAVPAARDGRVPPASVHEHRFRVMASDAQVILVGAAPDAARRAERLLRGLEKRWSRFLPDSDLSRAVAAPGRWTPVAPETLLLVDTMRRAASVTGGAFDPTLVRELLAEGRPPRPGSPPQPVLTADLPAPGRSIHDVDLDHLRIAMRVPDGLALDPGGVGKGLAADLAVADLLAGGTEGALVSIGGDLAAGGRPVLADGWPVTIDHPRRPGCDLVTLSVGGGGVATSSTLTQRWQRRGAWRHHVLDPGTGRSSTTDLVAVTVVAPTGWEAEVHATAALLAGSCRVAEHLRTHGLAGLAVATAGGPVVVGIDVDGPTGSVP